jgi:hypothetical protein
MGIWVGAGGVGGGFLGSGVLGEEDKRIAANREQEAGERHSLDCAVLVFLVGVKRGVCTEVTELRAPDVAGKMDAEKGRFPLGAGEFAILACELRV